jgi:hypothetical protein
MLMPLNRTPFRVMLSIYASLTPLLAHLRTSLSIVCFSNAIKNTVSIPSKAEHDRILESRIRKLKTKKEP